MNAGSTGSIWAFPLGFPVAWFLWVAWAWIDDLAFSLSLVTYDKRFSGGAGAAGRRVGFSLIIGYK